ncbi:MAG: glycosyltransferase [Terracidiphilus sp.]|nr:glycosyltransferase [Terracidiphilus sp.]
MLNSVNPRVLVISHRAFNDKGASGNALASYFKHWDADALAELYFYAELPCGPMSGKCREYYQITDFDALRSALGRPACGRTLGGADIAAAVEENESGPSRLQQLVYEFGRKKHPSVMLLRDAIWRAAHWRTPAFNHWVDKFRPELIFLVGGDYTFAYDIASHVARRCDIPLVVFMGDDWYGVSRFSLSPLYWLHKALLRRTMHRVVGSAARLFTACDQMSEEYQRIFNVESTTLPTACGPIAPEPVLGAGTPVELSYIGKVSLGRWTTLRKIGEALAEINAPQQRARLRIYSTERLNRRMLKRLSIPGAMEFMGGLSALEVRRVIERSDILVHVESMDKVNRKLTRLSLSTKIPEYLASGRCIFVAGPAEVGSIRYVQDHEAGVVVTDMEALRENLKALIANPELRRRHALNGLRLAHQRHDAKVIGDLLDAALGGVVGSTICAPSALAAARQ